MLVSSGRIIAIDKVYTDETISGDGVQHLLGVNTDLIASISSVANVSSQLVNDINSVSGNFTNYYTKSETSAADEISAALAANFEKFVTSADTEFDTGLAYVLTKEHDNVTWSGVDLSNIGVMYGIDSLTPELISAGISADEHNNPIYVLSANKTAECPAIAGYGVSAWKDVKNDTYNVSANIIGNHGIYAQYNTDDNAWRIGISANNYSYFVGLYDKQAVLTNGSTIKYDSSNTQNIDIDENGYITLPDTGNKFTFCVNETIENNTSTSHDYKLNKISLIKVDTQTNAEESIVATHSYYPSEVGASDANIAFTLSHSPNYKYAVKYLGSTIPTTANFVSKLSIIEEITSLATTEGDGRTYGGVEPIWTDNDANLIGLAFNRSQFKIVSGVDIEHPELSALQINIETTAGPIDQEAFEKMATLIDNRLTETFPIGLVCDEGTVAANSCISYMFRPSMTYDCTSATSAYIYNGTVDDDQVYARIGIYKLNNDVASLVWKSQLTLIKKNTQNVFVADPAVTGTISTENLYYACILTNNKQIGDILGITTHGTASVGSPAPWCTVNNIASTTAFGNTDFSQTVSYSDFGSFTDTIKPYIGLRGSTNG